MLIHHKKTITSAVLSVSALFLLSGCDRADNHQTVGQKIDSALTDAENKTDALIAQVAKETAEAKIIAANNLDDVTTTASINAELLEDAQLSAAKINVDTHANKVTLIGTAPDETSKARAALIAKNTRGVLEVDNQLTVVTP